MTKQTEALKMAIEWMEKYHQMHIIEMEIGERWIDLSMAIQACKEALEQPAQEHLCTYSRAINQQYPRKCIHCGKVEALAQPAQEFDSREFRHTEIPVAYTNAEELNELKSGMTTCYMYAQKIDDDDIALYTHR